MSVKTMLAQLASLTPMTFNAAQPHDSAAAIVHGERDEQCGIPGEGQCHGRRRGDARRHQDPAQRAWPRRLRPGRAQVDVLGPACREHGRQFGVGEPGQEGGETRQQERPPQRLAGDARGFTENAVDAGTENDADPVEGEAPNPRLRRSSPTAHTPRDRGEDEADCSRGAEHPHGFPGDHQLLPGVEDHHADPGIPVEITASGVALAFTASSRASPIHANASHAAARTSAVCSPTPPVKTRASIP